MTGLGARLRRAIALDVLGMRVSALLRESLASAVTRPVPSVLVALLVASTCLVTLLTVGQTASAEAQVRDRLEAAGSRLLVINDKTSLDLVNPTVVELSGALTSVETSVGFARPIDVVLTSQGAGGLKTPLVKFSGDIENAVRLTSGRWPGLGEAIVSDSQFAALGMDGPVGALNDGTHEWAIVGTYDAPAPFAELGGGAIAPLPENESATTLMVVATSAATAIGTERRVIAIVAPPSFDAIAVDSPATIAELQAGVGADVGAYGRSILIIVLLGGGVLTAMVVFADTLIRRVDLGRRRALGVTRAALALLIGLRALFPAIVGALIGTLVGVLVGVRRDTLPPAGFVAGVAILAILVAGIATLPPAIAASRADPVRVLRKP